MPEKKKKSYSDEEKLEIKKAKLANYKREIPVLEREIADIENRILLKEYNVFLSEIGSKGLTLNDVKKLLSDEKSDSKSDSISFSEKTAPK